MALSCLLVHKASRGDNQKQNLYTEINFHKTMFLGNNLTKCSIIYIKILRLKSQVRKILTKSIPEIIPLLSSSLNEGRFDKYFFNLSLILVFSLFSSSLFEPVTTKKSKLP